MKQRRFTLSAALLAGTFVASAAVLAAPPAQYENSRMSVSFADLNIDSAAGARVLYARLKYAAEAVCGVQSYREHGALALQREAARCYRDTLDEAVADIESSALERVHAG